MSYMITPALFSSFNGGFSLWENGTLLGHFPDRLVARRIAALLEVYGLIDMPESVEEVIRDYWEESA